MLFNSVEFIIFFPIVLAVYFIIPEKFKSIWLLIASYFYYMCWNAKYILLILASTLITYASGLLLEKSDNADVDESIRKKRKNLVVAVSFLSNISLLFIYKYLDFTCEVINWITLHTGISFNIQAPHLLLPVGISFYTFQALSYTMDVYRKETNAENNFIQYALFVSFFPQLVAGPIERSKNLLRQLAVHAKFSFEDLREGVLLMLWGYFLKLVLADRIALLVDTVYGDYTNYPGWYVPVATMFFMVQLYCDFAGYSTIAIGAAKILGISLMENFNAPYMSSSVEEFWRRWHISLTTWFRDYLYFPLGGSRKGTLRKYINIMIVFVVSGLWHGASVTYVVWGALNGALRVIGDILKPFRKAVAGHLHIDTDKLGAKVIGTIVTFMLLTFVFIFMRASTMADAVAIIKQVFTVNNFWILFDGSLFECGLDKNGFLLLLSMIAVLVVADLCKYRGIVIRNIILRQERWFRCLFIAIAILVIMTFGIYGPVYGSSAFIYFQF
ncbi:MAG: MBOAT family protein [Lachnospiraceae bacterium]|nr:MBOAT family protein [Lachnospiraceae bacterium]